MKKSWLNRGGNPFYYIRVLILLNSIFIQCSSCKKLVEIPEPVNSVTTGEVFSSDAQANSALAGIYTSIINTDGGNAGMFGNSSTTILCGLSSDELIYFYGSSANIDIYEFNSNVLLSNNSALYSSFWAPMYYYIYQANASIEGLLLSTGVHDSVRTVLTGEAKFIRAFCYFYLVNLFGDVPLVLTTDFNKSALEGRTPQKEVYKQIIQDLIDAQGLLVADFSTSHGERIRPNKWAATALLARVYLYNLEYANAFAQSNSVINNSVLFKLDTLNGVFLKNSNEAIWQLQQNTSINNGTATFEGANIIPSPQTTGLAQYNLSAEILNAFEYGDKRRMAWVDSTNYENSIYYYSFKYKIGNDNKIFNGPASEYYMMLRLAEQYLIRAEAEANGANGGFSAAIADLNIIRQRAGLTALPYSLTQQQIMSALIQERRIELFSEWGHRWLDLKRWGIATQVLTANKGYLITSNMLLYLIPDLELQIDPNLRQNPDRYRIIYSKKITDPYLF